MTVSRTRAAGMSGASGPQVPVKSWLFVLQLGPSCCFHWVKQQPALLMTSSSLIQSLSFPSHGKWGFRNLCHIPLYEGVKVQEKKTAALKPLCWWVLVSIMKPLGKACCSVGTWVLTSHGGSSWEDWEGDNGKKPRILLDLPPLFVC